MNEIQIIQKQLATEREHFTEVASLATTFVHEPIAGHSLLAACTDYFAFAVTRFPPQAAETLAAQLAGGVDADFLRAFEDAARTHYAQLDPLLARNLPVTEWRAISRIDADSVFAERARYARVKAAIPT
ncbi:MAG: hypothetical protein JSR66_03770 [Proteobacteria bacterium]|nr:hypothetical protein [Pseudomonadota bacterium]